MYDGKQKEALMKEKSRDIRVIKKREMEKEEKTKEERRRNKRRRTRGRQSRRKIRRGGGR